MRGANEYYNIFHNLNNTVMEDSGVIMAIDDQYQYKHIVCVCSLYGTDPMFTIYAVMDTDIVQKISEYDNNKKQEVYGMIKGTDGWWNKCVWKYKGPWIDQFNELLNNINQQQSIYNKLKEEQQEIINLTEQKKIEEKLKLLSTVFEDDLPSTSKILPGTTFNGLLTKIPGSSKIIFSSVAIEEDEIPNAVVVSTDDSETKTYMYRDSNGTINIMPEKSNCSIFANESCENMFNGRNDIEQVVFNNFNMENVTNMKRMFYGCTSIQYIDTSKFKTDNVEYFDEMFSMSGIVSLDIRQWNTKNGKTFTGFVNRCNSLYTFEHTLNVSSATDISNLCYECSNLVNISPLIFNFSNSDVHNLNAADLFFNCESLLSIDVSHVNGPIGKKFGWFNGCLSLNNIIGIEKINLSACTDLSNSFKNCAELVNINLDNAEVYNAEIFDGMFDGCNKLTKIGCDLWELTNAKSSVYMFRNCYNLKEEMTIVNNNMGDPSSYSGMFMNACTAVESYFKVNYTNSINQSTAEGMVATKSENSNIILGSQKG